MIDAKIKSIGRPVGWRLICWLPPLDKLTERNMPRGTRRIWHNRLKRAFGVGLPSGGYGQEELERAGAARIYEDPADLLRHLDEIGSRR
jgi:hypothetical protein